MEALKKSRGGFRSALTKLVQKLETALQENYRQEIETYYEQLKERESKLRDLDQKILNKLMEAGSSEEDISSEIEDVDNWVANIITMRKRVAQYLKGDVIATTAINNTDIKLPRLEIKKFSQGFVDWQRFWGQFEASIHFNPKITDVQRVTYLQSLLEEPASSAIAGIMLSDANYKIAIDRLKSRFGQKELIIHAHMTRLLEMKPVHDDSNVSALRKLYDDCYTQIQSLEALGMATNTYSSLLSPIILKLLPEAVLLEWNRHPASSAFKLEDLLNFLRIEVEGRERSALVSGTTVTRKNINAQVNEGRRTYSKELKPSANALFVKTSSSPKSEVDKTAPKTQDDICVFCQSTNHRTWDCEVDVSLEQRLEIIQKSGRCFQCLRHGHPARRCYRRRCENCKSRHHRLLCRQEVQGHPGKKLEQQKEVIVAQHVMVTQSNVKTLTLMKIVHAWAEGPKRWMRVQCVLDDGSHRSFVREEVANSLGLVASRTEWLAVKGFSSLGVIRHKFPVVTVPLRDPHDKREICQLEMLVIPEITSSVGNNDYMPAVQEMEAKGLRRACFPHWTFRSGRVDILFGLDTYWKVLTGCNYPLQNDLMASESRFGWVINGRLSHGDEETADTMVMFMSTQNLVSEEWVHDCWNLDAIGIQEKPCGQLLSVQDRQIQEKFERTIRYENGRYQVRLPWKSATPNLDSNWPIARRRLSCLLRSFEKDMTIYQRYQKAMMEYVENGHVEQVTKEESNNGVCYYLPHHAVIKEDRKTTKVRIVFDGSSHGKNAASLNSCLWTGPNLNPDILEILLRFRKHSVALLADIEKAFLQVELSPEDRDATRFLWLKPGWSPGKEAEICEFRMTRVLFGATSSPYLLAATIRHHLAKMSQDYPSVCQDLDTNLYIDDYGTGRNSVEEAYQLYKNSHTIMLKAGMPLKKWMTNSKELFERWKAENKSDDMTIQADQGMQKVLGVMWDPKADTLTLQCKGLHEFLQVNVPSKRSLLTGTARIFDPLGLVAPIVIKARCLFQEAWRRKLSWDEPLPFDLEEKWAKICNDLKNLGNVRIRRPNFQESEEIQSYELHVFCDASESAYGAVCYLRIQSQNGVSISFVASKGRVAPLKSVTLPRLELLGNVVGARLATYIRDALKIESLETTIWTDSTIVLHWVKNTVKKWEPFVMNRIAEMRTLFDPSCWRHCPGSDNPADLVSRGEFLQIFANKDKWWRGPTWLPLSKQEWPLDEQSKRFVDENKETIQLTLPVKSLHPSLLDLDKYSSLWRVFRVTAWILRFKDVTQKKSMGNKYLQAVEIEQATKYWIRQVQQECLSSEQRQDKEKPISERIVFPLQGLNPFEDEDGIMRVGGRLDEAILTEEEKHPIILPGKHRFTELLVIKHHVRLLHAGIAATLSNLRQFYWIIKARQTVKRIIQQCVICRRFRVKSAKIIEAPLPRDRLTQEPPFSVTGTDYAGPLFVRGEQQESKAYIVIFTCAVTRAIHLELVSDMTAEGFLLAFRRFVARRGLCRVLYSDNSKTFKRASRDLKEIWKEIRKEKVQDYVCKQGIQWKFIVEKAAWWGGFWERMVQSVKHHLKRILGRSCLRFEELTTVLTEVEAVLNARPLTAVYDSVEDPIPLTPAHFLNGGQISLLSCGSSSPIEEVSPSKLTARWKYRQRLLEHFWSRWKTDYLLQLRTAHQRRHTRDEKVLKTGDLVIVFDPKLPKHMWNYALVKEVYLGRDQKVRSCLVKVRKTGKCIRRPIQLLYPLELGHEGAGSVTESV